MMLDLHVPLIGFVVVWILFRGIVYIRKRTFSSKHEIIHGLFAFSLAFIYSVTIFPFPFYIYPHVQREIDAGINLIPFASIRQSLHHFYWLVPVRNIGGNIALFIPFGFFASRSTPLRPKTVVIVGFLLSFCIESIQLFFVPFRAFDVDDILLNTLGTTIGAALFRLLGQLAVKPSPTKQSNYSSK
ncbi:VanZ family protein [Parageobacillus thermoglucosidasius]|nr:VanZ family protein [Parageobacillus thermoglucosidasius]MED4913980.1 VanZ family protein [Parageobacillus thermoglucosidasius]